MESTFVHVVRRKFYCCTFNTMTMVTLEQQLDEWSGTTRQNRWLIVASYIKVWYPKFVHRFQLWLNRINVRTRRSTCDARRRSYHQYYNICSLSLTGILLFLYLFAFWFVRDGRDKDIRRRYATTNKHNMNKLSLPYECNNDGYS
jgi:hypothetical protein